MRKVLSLAVALAILLTPLSASSVAAPWGVYRGYPVVRVLVDNQEVRTDVPAHVADGRTLVPLRFVAEALGAAVTWDEQTFQVTVSAVPRTALPDPALQAEVARLRADLEQLGRELAALRDSIISPAAVVTAVQQSVVGIIATQVFPGGRQVIGQGTGVVVSSDGRILTNTHVVKARGATTTNMLVILHDGRALRAELVNHDYLSDVAVVRVTDAVSLVAATLGDSDRVIVGQPVIAIGNPLSLGLRNTVTVGVISGLNRADQSAYPLLQTDAAINRGNSGGPLVDFSGQVIGITSSKVVAEGVEGLGFALPMNLVRSILARFTDRGIVRPFLGVVVEESPFAGLNVPNARGLSVVELAPRSPAVLAGLQVGDVLRTLNDRPIRSLLELRTELEQHSPGQRITLGIRRGQTDMSLSVTLGSLATEDTPPFRHGAIYSWEAEF
ncbi:MAG: trypsin-like peptidase domain-containing protein [Selenomonadales bacterium]|nr:trypsin-like peptidase domain-containing protein [Selenomonadales bacterium]